MLNERSSVRVRSSAFLFRSVVKLVNTAEKEKFYQLLPQKECCRYEILRWVRFIGGSSPSAPAIYLSLWWNWYTRSAQTRNSVGSNPTRDTKTSLLGSS